MRIAIPSMGTTPDDAVEARFARAAHFLLFDDATGAWDVIENAQVAQVAQGAGIQAAETLARHGVQVLLSTHCGPKAFRALQAAGITVYVNISGTAEAALQAYRAGSYLPATGPDVEGHW